MFNNQNQMPEPTPGCECDSCKFILAFRESEAESLLFAEALRSAQTAISVAALKSKFSAHGAEKEAQEEVIRASGDLVKVVTRALASSRSQIESAVDQFKAGERDKKEKSK